MVVVVVVASRLVAVMAVAALARRRRFIVAGRGLYASPSRLRLERTLLENNSTIGDKMRHGFRLIEGQGEMVSIPTNY